MSIYSDIANAGNNAGAGINAFARGKYEVQQQEQQNAFAKEQKMQDEFRYAKTLGPDAGLTHLQMASQRMGVPPPDPAQIRPYLEQGYQASMAQMGGAQYGTTPHYYEDAEGNLQVGQFSRDGGILPVQAPGGGKWRPPMTPVNQGSQITMVDPRTGNAGVAYPVELRPGEQPAVKGAQQDAIEASKISAIPEAAEATAEGADTTAAADAKRAFKLTFPQVKTVTTDARDTLVKLRDRIAKLPTGPGYGPAFELVSPEMQAASAQLTEQALTAIAAMKEKGVSLTPLTEKEVAILFDLSALSSRYPEANVDILNRKIAEAERKLGDLEDFAGFVNGGGNPLEYEGPARIKGGDGWEDAGGGIRVREKK